MRGFLSFTLSLPLLFGGCAGSSGLAKMPSPADISCLVASTGTVIFALNEFKAGVTASGAPLSTADKVAVGIEAGASLVDGSFPSCAAFIARLAPGSTFVAMPPSSTQNAAPSK